VGDPARPRVPDAGPSWVAWAILLAALAGGVAVNAWLGWRARRRP
jgi:hypothetical protein